MNTKKQSIYTRVTEAEYQRLAILAERMDVPVSQIVREGLREKIAKLEAAELESAAAVETVAA